MPFIFSLKRALALNFLLVAAIPILLFGLISINLISKYQLDGVRERNMLQARSVAEEVESFLLEISSDLNHVKQVISSDHILQSDNIGPFLATVLNNSQFFESIYLLDDNLRVRHFAVLPDRQPRHDDYPRLDFSDHMLFQKAIETKQPRWSNTFVSLVTGEPAVTLCLTLPDGFLLGNVRLESLSRLLHRYSVYGGFHTAVVDRGGGLIAYTEIELAEQRVSFNNHPTVVSALSGKSSTEEIRRGDDLFLESAVLIPTPGWVAWVGLDMYKIQEPIEKMRNLLISFMVVAIFLACILALINVRRLMRPLTALGHKTRQIADGRYEFSYQPSGFTEIDNLANQIANMSEAISVREDSIITSEQRFRDLVNSIDGIVWEMEYPSFRYLFVSRQAEFILGHPLDDWYNNESFWQNVTHEDDWEQARAYCRLMAEKHNDHDFEYRIIAADGRTVWIRNLVTVVVENGRPVRLLGVMIDITSQKELLEELSRSEQNYREIFNSTSDAIFIHDADTGQVLDVNQATLNMFETTYEDALLYGLEELCTSELPYSTKDAKLKLNEACIEGISSFEWISRRSGGETFWTEVHLRSATIGGQQRVLSAVRDISDRKAAEEELQQYRTQLEELVSERTSQLEIAQRELVQKERLAVLGQLTATVSHEIRNPLGTVANSLYLLKTALCGDEHARLERPLALAERNVERCDNIISDLLDFSRQRKTIKKPLSLDVWLADLIKELGFPEQVRCLCDFKSHVTVLADAERLRRVMVNVITNALQALEESQNSDMYLEIQTRLCNDRCEIVVRDNGIGMDEGVMSRISEPMFSTKNFGVGLGVPIINNILEGHGGGVEYQSKAGQGTSVMMWLPVAEDIVS